MQNRFSLFQYPSKSLTYFGLVLLLFTVFFPIRHVFLTKEAYLTGQYTDFTSFSLYLSDILIILDFFLVSWKKKALLLSDKTLFLLIVWLALVFLANIRPYSVNQLYFSANIIIAIVLYETIKKIWNISLKSIFTHLFVSFSLLQSLLAIWQFMNQKSLGLYILGESHISPIIDGVAKIVAHGTRYIRGYGTFPHPNPLSAFLFAAIIFSVYLILTTTAKRLRFYYHFALIINIFGLFLTFSRAGILVTVLGLATLFLWLVRIEGLKKISSVVIAVVVTIALCIALLFPFLSSKTSFSDQSSLARIFYAKVGLKTIQNKPIFGTGPGTNVLYVEKYSPISLLPWQKQPIHNYYLLAASEIGIVGALIILYFFWSKIKGLWGAFKRSELENQRIFRFSILLIFSGFLVLMLFDHYFWDIKQTQILLWLILGIMAGESEQKNSDVVSSPLPR